MCRVYNLKQDSQVHNVVCEIPKRMGFSLTSIQQLVCNISLHDVTHSQPIFPRARVLIVTALSYSALSYYYQFSILFEVCVPDL